MAGSDASYTAPYTEGQRDELARRVLEDGYCVLPCHFDRATLEGWRQAFAPLLEAHIAREGHRKNRGAERYYVTLPFVAPFADPRIFEDDAVLGIVGRLVGEDPVLCQLATDTPLLGSDYQDVQRDTPPLFPEWGRETPPFQLAVNFALVDVTGENGPVEIARGTHMEPKEDALARIARGEVRLEPVAMRVGDVMIRDVRGLHRGSPNRTATPRPMCVLGYSRRWLFRPEVSIRVPRETHEHLSPRARTLLRYAQVVDVLDAGGDESYQAFAY